MPRCYYLSCCLIAVFYYVLFSGVDLVDSQENPKGGIDIFEMENKLSPNHNIKKRFSFLEYVFSNSSIFDHVDWGTNKTTMYAGEQATHHRAYFGYGTCRKRRQIDYHTDIEEATDTHEVLMAYADLFRFQCNDDKIRLLDGFIEKGYLYMDLENSMELSTNSLLFIKHNLTYAEKNDLEELVMFSAYTQVYVSWYKFPVGSIDPTAEPIQDAGFIELISKLHAMDVIKSLRREYMTEISYEMGMKLKRVLRKMRDQLRKIHMQSKSTVQRIAKRINTLAVTMGLMEFLTEHSHDVLSDLFGCSHVAFEEFYTPKKPKYVDLATTLGSLQLQLD